MHGPAESPPSTGTAEWAVSKEGKEWGGWEVEQGQEGVVPGSTHVHQYPMHFLSQQNG